MSKRKQPDATAVPGTWMARWFSVVSGTCIALLFLQVLALAAGPAQPMSFVPGGIALLLAPVALVLRRRVGRRADARPSPDGETLAATAHGMAGLGPMGRTGTILAANAHANRASRD